MNFNKCCRCGCFFSNKGNICPNCVSKETIETEKLENYLEEYSIPNSIQQISYDTGIPTKNIERLINTTNKFSNLTNLNLT
ncbi:MAG: hypothetical protein E7313_06295 [Clostridiales bacterium]|nr:hypothetical protein [Clostridiales bacterium]